jgi:hypothetical protein
MSCVMKCNDCLCCGPAGSQDEPNAWAAWDRRE